MAMRAKELGSLGMQVNEKGQVIVAKSSSLVKEIETELVEEVGLKCCICMEGYRNQPSKVREGVGLKCCILHGTSQGGGVAQDLHGGVPEST
jgi:hypothetical protein